MTFWFDTPKTHVGFYMGNGADLGLPGAMVGYDAAGNVICQITNIVPEKYTEFIGMVDPAGRIQRITLNYGATLLSESIDDLTFAPFDKADAVHVEVGKSSNEVFEAAFDFPRPQIVRSTAQQKNFTQVLLPGIDPNTGAPAGLPDVPIYRRLLAVPQGAKPFIAGVQTLPGDELSNVLLLPAQPPAMDQNQEFNPDDFIDPPFVIDDKAYRADTNFPANVAELKPIGRMRDLEVWQLEIAAGQFNPAKQSLRLFEDVKVQIKFEGGDGGFLPKDTMDNPFDQSFDGIYAQVLNYAALRQYPGPGIITGRVCLGHEFLIITDPAFRPAADTLRTWKVSKGISTVVLETGNGPGQIGATNTAIRDTIVNRYNNCVVRPSYLLLLGDAEHIAPFYRFVLNGPSAGTGDNAGTDLDYSLMNAGDIAPDLAYGRIPVDTLSDAQLVVDKIVAYEQTPPFNFNFYRNVTTASYFQCCRADVANDGTDSRSFVETSELVRDHLRQPRQDGGSHLQDERRLPR